MITEIRNRAENKKMNAQQKSLTKTQINSFDRFLVDGTGNTLNALTGMFGLNIDSSNSTIEIASAVHSENLNRLGSGALYVVTSALLGDMQGSIVLLMRKCDFECLGDVMKPILNLLFLSSTDTDLATLDSQKPDWMRNSGLNHSSDPVFHEQMMDTLSEMGNVIIGLYTKAIYKNYKLNTHHSLPKTLADPEQQTFSQIVSSSEVSEPLHMIIENEFIVMAKPIKIWCVISPTLESFQNMLNVIDSDPGYGNC